ncbi:hypothetical protein DPMN_012381 [Dreissena polymorpha]|uniref:Uncharacterized protein n=1 Tax=Dreissena polymorpha TaxID=45954 RepID=A0A9D4N2D9_DREPO|nr:hypothetical protein DPMN_012381 [Dreissena polymorpha]
MAVPETTYDIIPLKVADLVEKISIPIALYGSEVWSSLTNDDILKLKRFIRFTAKSANSQEN